MPDGPVHEGQREADLPLEELRRAWAAAEPPRPDPALDEADGPTRAAVAWMAAAWSQVEAPQPVVPLALRARSRGRQRWLQPLAAAAGVVLALSAAFWLQRSGPVVRPDGVHTETTAQVEGPAPALPDTDVEVAALAPDRVELRSGPVRLILLTGEDSPQNR